MEDADLKEEMATLLARVEERERERNVAHHWKALRDAQKPRGVGMVWLDRMHGRRSEWCS